MKRPLESWANCDPDAMSRMSEGAIYYALSDAKADILKMAALLKRIAYPKRGSADEQMDIFHAAEMIQAEMPREFFGE